MVKMIVLVYTIGVLMTSSYIYRNGVWGIEYETASIVSIMWPVLMCVSVVLLAEGYISRLLELFRSKFHKNH